jgi:hypothetical protein
VTSISDEQAIPPLLVGHLLDRSMVTSISDERFVEFKEVFAQGESGSNVAGDQNHHQIVI